MRAFFLILVFSMFTEPALSQFIGRDDVIKYQTVNPVGIDIHDRAINGCWTNIGEARNYLADQLELGGFELAEENENLSSMVELTVAGERLNNGVCTGIFIFDFRMPATVRGTDGFTEVSLTSQTSYAVGENFNIQVLEGAKRFANDFLAKRARENAEAD